MGDSLLILPDNALVALVGMSGAGKTTFASRHFSPSQVLTSDRFREMVSDNQNSMQASKDAFEVLYLIARKRLARGLLTVIDATNIQDFARAKLFELAEEHGAPLVAVVLNVPLEIAMERTLKRTDRPFGSDVVMEHYREFQETMDVIHTEGFQSIHLLDGVQAIDQAIITTQTSPPFPVDQSPVIAAPMNGIRLST